MNNLFESMPVGKRLFIGFGSILLILIMLGVVGYNGISNISNLSLKTFNNDEYIAQHAETLRGSVLGLRRFEKDVFLNIRNDNKRAEYKEKWDKLYKTTNSEISDISIKLKKNDYKNDSALLEEGKNSFNVYAQGLTDLYSRIIAGSINTPQEGNTAINKYKSAIHSLEGITTKLATNCNARAEKSKKGIEDKAAQTLAIMMVVVFISILWAIAISITIANSLILPLKKLSQIGLRLADHDYTVAIPDDKNKTEIGDLNRTFKSFVENLKDLICNLNDLVANMLSNSEQTMTAIDQTTQGSQQVSLSITQLATGSQEQANNVSTSVENVNKMGKAIQTISQGANHTVELSKSTEDNSVTGQNQAEMAVGKIDQIKTKASKVSNTINELGILSSDIEQIVDLIKGIANQTNLLALNAAIEAARAGEQGKGFAVVADEVKKLAGESANATDKIIEMIKDIQNKTNTAVSTMNEAIEEVENGVAIVKCTGDALREITDAAKNTNTQIVEISKEVNGLADNSDSIVKMMESMAAITEETAASTEEISSIVEEQTASLEEINTGSKSLVDLAKNLQKQISIFKI